MNGLLKTIYSKAYDIEKIQFDVTLSIEIKKIPSMVSFNSLLLPLFMDLIGYQKGT